MIYLMKETKTIWVLAIVLGYSPELNKIFIAEGTTHIWFMKQKNQAGIYLANSCLFAVFHMTKGAKTVDGRQIWSMISSSCEFYQYY